MGYLLHFVVGFALLLHVLFWGSGAAMLAMPRAWRRFWPVLVVPMGFALQSAVVWAGAHAGLRGTNSYALASEAVPLGLLGFALWRCGLRAPRIDLSRFGLVGLATGAGLLLLMLPLPFASRGLATLSLGSCDAADYAAGARVLMEFAQTDRVGFLGLSEVVRVQSVDNFFDYWTRLNHFTPSALIAFNGSVFDCAPHEIASLMTMVIMAGSMPAVFWIARAALGYSGAASLAVMVLYGLSPVAWYAVGHVSPGQLLAAQAIALLTWAAVALWRGRLGWRRWAQFGGVFAAGYWLILGSYNFILLVCLVPAFAYAGGLAAWHGQWRRLGCWALMVTAPLLVCGAVFFERVAGLAERFALLRTYDFGWRIPALTPEGWLGMVSGPALEAWHWGGARWVLAALVGGVLAWAVARAIRQRQPGVWIAACFTVPVLVGYAYLQWRGARLGTNASYDAYKLFAVFHPLMLPAMCWWVTLRRSRRLTEWMGVVAFALVVGAFNLAATGMFVFRMANPPLIVDGELRQLRRVEAMADVASVNLRIPDMWSRLWANAFLLRKPQYFLTHTYEGRLNTPLRGEWDLLGGSIALRLPDGGSREITPHYSLVRTQHPAYLRVALGDGWHAEERLPRTFERWQWSGRRATVQLENPHNRPIEVECTFDWRGFGERRVACNVPGPDAAIELNAPAARAKTPPLRFVVPPGRSEIALNVSPAAAVAANDGRELGVCLFGFSVEVRE